MIEPSRSKPHTAPQLSEAGSRRKILLVINGMDFGGAETILFQTAVGLDRRGYEVHVLTLKTPGRTAAQLQEQGILVSTLGMSENVNPWNVLKASWKLRRWLLGARFDVIHSFLPRANIMSRIAHRLSWRSPHVSSERSTDYNRSRLVSRLNRLTAPWTGGILAVSSAVGRVLIARDGIDAGKIRLLGNGVDLTALDAVPPAVADQSRLGSIPSAPLRFWRGRECHRSVSVGVRRLRR